MALNKLEVKIVSMILLGGVSLIFGLLPIKVGNMLNWQESTTVHGKPKKSKVILSAMLCFGGGVILATVFCHLLPEVHKFMKENISNGSIPDTGLPLTELIVCSGFFLIYIMEELTHTFVNHYFRRLDKKKSDSMRENNTANDEGIANLGADIEANAVGHSHEHSHGSSYGHSHEIPLGDMTLEGGSSFQATLRGFLIILALSLHAIFEGMAVGLQHSALHVWYLFFAIAAHKYVIAFCVGLQCVTTGVKTMLVVLYLSTFSLITPLGIGIGMGVTETYTSESDLNNPLMTVLQGIATGTLIYVAFFEILEEERSKHYNGFMQLAFVLLGFAVMFGLTTLGNTLEGTSQSKLEEEKISNITTLMDKRMGSVTAAS